MRFTVTHAIIALLSAVIVVLSWTLVYFARDELRWGAEHQEEEIETPNTAAVEGGRAIVRTTAESQVASGIETRPLAAGTSEAALEVHGQVMDLQPLAELRGRYLATVAEARALRAGVAVAESEFRRMEALYQDDRNVSEQALRAAESRYRSEQARLAAAEQGAASLRDALRGQWGATISGWATDADSRVLQSLLDQRAFLVQLVLPYQLPRDQIKGSVLVSPVMARENRRAARYVADSPRVDSALPGETYFYLVDGGGLRAGMRVTARVSLGGARLDGVVVPASAVVWYAGKAWAYLRKDPETFARYEVSTAQELNGGWFNATSDNGAGLEAGDEVVVGGAQLLLSEELKYQIRNENED